MLQVVQAFDRVPIAEIPTEDAVALEAKLQAATRTLRDRDGGPISQSVRPASRRKDAT